jgi:hypothetical protein
MSDTYEKLCLIASDVYDALHIPLSKETTLKQLRQDWIFDAGFAFTIGKEFGIRITPDEFNENFKDDTTLGEIAGFIDSKGGEEK